jgi:ribosomal protein S18 acetylase RimI-like enzyme
MIEIRKASNEQDIQKIADLANIIWHEHFTPIIGEAQVEYMLDKFQSFKAISEAVNVNNYIYYMAFDDGEFCGYIGIHPENKAVLLSKIYVEKSHRGKKISKQMIETVRNDYSDYDYMWLTVNKHNSNSIAAYKKMGFEITREQVADIGSGFVMDDYIMEKKIN